jgi:YVTN family beta-propeller protein
MDQKPKTGLGLVVVSAWLALAGAAGATGEYVGPNAVAATEDGTTLFVACSDARQVAWIDTASGAVTRRVDVPGRPTGLVLTPDASSLVVTCDVPETVVLVLDAKLGERRKAFPAGNRPMDPVLSADGARLYVCNQFDHDVSVIAMESAEEIARVPVTREPIAADVTPDGRYLVVANHLPNTRTDRIYDGDIGAVVTIVDTETFVTHDVRLRRGAHGLRGVCVSPDGRHALVTHLMANFDMVPFRVDTGWINVNVVSVIDLAERKLVSTVGMDYYDLGVGNPWDICYSADGQQVCVSLSGAHQLCVISEEELLGDFALRTMQPMMAVWPIYLSLGESLWKRVRLPGRGPRGLAAAGSKFYATQYFSDSIVAIELDSQPTVGDGPVEEVDVPYLGAYDSSDDTNSDSTYSSSPYASTQPTYSAYDVHSIPLGPEPQLTLERRGELLFNDATICSQQWQSCASCHPDGRTDGLVWDLMNDDQGNPKNTKSMLLSHVTPPSMATGVRATAEVAVRSGLEHILFAYRPEDEAAAIDAYLMSLEPVPSPHLVDGQLSPSAERGREIFERVSCDRCHPAPLYTDLKMHNVGTTGYYDYRDRFDTPTLVEVWRTAPYVHDGRYVTLKELFTVGKHGLKGRQGKKLSEQEIDDLVQFVLSL